MTENLKVLVTGGAGYIGSHTILEILETRNWNVVSIDNYLNSSEQTYDRIKAISGNEIKYYATDLCDFQGLNEIFKNENFDCVIHFAALKSVPESTEKPLEYYHNNINGLLNLINCCNGNKVKNFIFSSSCSVYGNTNVLPVDEDTAIGEAESPYAYTKQIGEQIINDTVNSDSKMKFISLRYFNPVGGHKTGLNGEVPLQIPNNLVPFITQTAAGIRENLIVYGGDYNTPDGTCIRDYIHVSDIANAHLLAIDRLLANRNESAHEIFNLGTGKGVSVLEIINAFESVNNLSLNYKMGDRRPGDVEKIYADNSLAREKLQWNPEFGIEEMMRSAWLWEQEMAKN